MDIVNNIRCDVNGALEAEGRIGAPNIVVDGFGQGHNIHAGVHKELCAFLRAVAAHDDKAVEIEPVISILHSRDEAVSVFVNDVLSRDIALARGAKNGSALSEYACEILRLHKFIVAVNKSAVAVIHAEYLKIFDFIVQSLADAAHGRVESLTVAAGGYKGNSGYLLQI